MEALLWKVKSETNAGFTMMMPEVNEDKGKDVADGVYFLPLPFCLYATNNTNNWVQLMCFHTDKTPPLFSYDIIGWA